tara:strand:- start:2500 stop:2763 length:264 start_codon:yes stop_codon:yes gene_type:complete
MKREAFLDSVKTLLEVRENSYGDPDRHWEKVSRRWSHVLGKPITTNQAIQCMMELKMERLIETPGHLDSIADIVGYAAILYELESEK